MVPDPLMVVGVILVGFAVMMLAFGFKTLAPRDQTVEDCLKELRTRIPVLYSRFSDEKLDSLDILRDSIVVRDTILVLWARGLSRGQGGDTFTFMVKIISNIYENHLTLFSTGAWVPKDAQLHTNAILSVVNMALEFERRRPLR